MEFTADSTRFQQALTIVGASINTRLSIPAATGVLVEASKASYVEGDTLTLTATDIDTVTRITIPARVKAPGTLLVGAGPLQGFTVRIPASEVSVSVDKKKGAIMRAGRRAYTLPVMDAKDFPTVWEHEGGTPLLSLTHAHLEMASSRVGFAVSTEEKRKNLWSVGVRWADPDSVRFCAADGHRVALVQVAVSHSLDEGQQISILPDFLSRASDVFEGASADVFYTGQDNNLIAFKGEDRLFMCRTPVEPFIGEQFENVVRGGRMGLIGWMECNKSALQGALQAIDVVAAQEAVHPVRLEVSGGKCLLYTQTGHGVAEDDVEVEHDTPEDYVAVFNCTNLMDAVRRVPGDRVRIDLPATNMQPVFLSAAERHADEPVYEQMVVPLNPNAGAAAGVLGAPRR